MNAITYLQGVAAELKKVSWPSAATVVRYFLSVVIGVSLATVVIFGLDTIFLKGLELIIK